MILAADDDKDGRSSPVAPLAQRLSADRPAPAGLFVVSRAVALHAFPAEADGDLALTPGDEIEVTAKGGGEEGLEEWWQGFLTRSALETDTEPHVGTDWCWGAHGGLPPVASFLLSLPLRSFLFDVLHLFFFFFFLRVLIWLLLLVILLHFAFSTLLQLTSADNAPYMCANWATST